MYNLSQTLGLKEILTALDETESMGVLERKNDVEKHPENCNFCLNMFCSHAKRITVNSIIDRTFLFDDGEYGFVLTAKFNQDCIEVLWDVN